MKYLKQGVFLAVSGEPFQVLTTDADGTQHPGDGMIGEVLKAILYRYQPQQGQVLNMGDLRRLNKAIDALEETSTPNDCFVFEDEEWGVVKRVFAWLAPVTLARNAPLLEDIMNAVTSRPPEEE